MEELKRINRMVAIKQIGRVAGAITGFVVGGLCLMRFAYQDGYTNCQKHISKDYPEEYASMTEKLVNMINSNH